MLNPSASHPFYEALKKNTQQTGSRLCVGLDPDITKIPALFEHSISGVEDFLTRVMAITQELCIAYKPNISFFEGLGLDGLHLLERLRKRVPAGMPWIIDGKRGDIGNTSAMQARFLYDHLGADAVTLHPYMGLDSLEPFFSIKHGYNFVLALTSNPSAVDFEAQPLANTQAPLYLSVTQKCAQWNETFTNIGCVVGATQADAVHIRAINPHLLFLVPGVGAQGGDYASTLNRTQNDDGLALINVSRAVLYPQPQYESLSHFEKTIKTALLSIL
jgi:orotidine-5'-phosphate decarboxylase